MSVKLSTTENNKVVRIISGDHISNKKKSKKTESKSPEIVFLKTVVSDLNKSDACKQKNNREYCKEIESELLQLIAKQSLDPDDYTCVGKIMQAINKLDLR